MKIYVVKNNLLLGTLKESPKSIVFTYSDSIDETQYLRGLSEKDNENTELFPIFGNMLPENEQLELLKAKYGITGQIKILLFLSDIHGSYEFYSEEDFKKLTLKKQDIFIYNKKKEEILDNNYKFPNILKSYTLNISDDILYPTEYTTPEKTNNFF